ncbi:MAG: YqjF family protein [Mucilaginibacter sp.]
MAKRKFMEARWENLLMLNYEVPPEILEPYLPPYTVLDYWQGKALVSMVGFEFLQTRVLGVKWPFHVDFEEVNLRFYVKYFDGREWKRGAVFISEIVPKNMIALIANNLYNEHYRALPMRHSQTPAGDNHLNFLYEWKLKGRWNKLGATVSTQFNDIQPGSQEEFIFEHYWGYNKLTAASTMQYQVEHISWQVANVTNPVFDGDIAALYGEEFVPFLSVHPYSAFFANGSAINVRIGEKILADLAPPISPVL